MGGTEEHDLAESRGHAEDNRQFKSASRAVGDAGTTMPWHVSERLRESATSLAPQADLEGRWKPESVAVSASGVSERSANSRDNFWTGMATSIAAESLSLSLFAPAVLRPVAFHLSTSPSWYVVITLNHQVYNTDLHP